MEVARMVRRPEVGLCHGDWRSYRSYHLRSLPQHRGSRWLFPVDGVTQAWGVSSPAARNRRKTL
ncbi:hypothetical protein KCP69_03765 [Salmonella enterica subsp. enterica]|nr:hypothetical protein KCP69_03765 [Salmonella enterica subsp. enterica]